MLRPDRASELAAELSKLSPEQLAARKVASGTVARFSALPTPRRTAEDAIVDRVVAATLAQFEANDRPRAARFAGSAAGGPTGRVADDDEHAGTWPGSLQTGEVEDPDEVSAYLARGTDALCAARRAHADWKACWRLTAGSGRRAIPLAQFLACHPAVLAATGRAELHGFRGA